MFGEVFKPGARVFRFTLSVIMRTRALSNTTKIDSQHYQPGIIQSRACAKDDLVVHRPAAEWMRVEKKSDASHGSTSRLLQNSFEPAMRNRNEKITCRIHLMECGASSPLFVTAKTYYEN
jgi:hypothetical protein